MKSLILINLVQIVVGLYICVDAKFKYRNQQPDSIGVAKRQTGMRLMIS